MSRRTLRTATPKLQGIGLHTGAPGWVRLLPSHPLTSEGSMLQSGISFRGAEEASSAPLAPSLVAETRRCTALDIHGARLSTVEHLLAAITSCGITDVIIEFEGPEVPILDGSALEFVEALNAVGTIDLDTIVELTPVQPLEPIVVAGRQGERLIALPSEEFSVTVVLDYPARPAIGAQAARYRSGGDAFAEEIAPARTYGFLSEFEQIRTLGLASGASLENCIALQDDGSPDPRTPLRFSNELARHKLLDVLGDLALVGRPILAEIVAVRPSHAVNCLLASRLAESLSVSR